MVLARETVIEQRCWLLSAKNGLIFWPAPAGGKKSLYTITGRNAYVTN